MKLLKKRLPCLAVTAAVLLALAACHGEKISESDKLTVVTTTTMLCDLAGQIGGERVEGLWAAASTLTNTVQAQEIFQKCRTPMR